MILGQQVRWLLFVWAKFNTQEQEPATWKHGLSKHASSIVPSKHSQITSWKTMFTPTMFSCRRKSRHGSIPPDFPILNSWIGRRTGASVCGGCKMKGVPMLKDMTCNRCGSPIEIPDSYFVNEANTWLISNWDHFRLGSFLTGLNYSFLMSCRIRNDKR